MDITKETAKRILELIRMCHPNEKGEKYTRWDVMDEIKRRGFNLLVDLGWSADFEHIYKNRYVGSEEKLKIILQGKENVEKLFSVLEHYTPKELWTDEDCFPEYKQKAFITGWLK